MKKSKQIGFDGILEDIFNAYYRLGGRRYIKYEQLTEEQKEICIHNLKILLPGFIQYDDIFDIIVLRYGFETGKRMSYTEIESLVYRSDSSIRENIEKIIGRLANRYMPIICGETTLEEIEEKDRKFREMIEQREKERRRNPVYLDDTSLPARVVRMLDHHNVTTFKQLIGMSEKFLLSLPESRISGKITPYCIREIKKMLAEYGLEMKQDEAQPGNEQ